MFVLVVGVSQGPIEKNTHYPHKGFWVLVSVADVPASQTATTSVWIWLEGYGVQIALVFQL